MKIFFTIAILFVFAFTVTAQVPLSERLADTAMNRIWVDERNKPGIPPKWTYDQGLVLMGIERVWLATGDAKYFNHIQKGMDHWFEKDGSIRTYSVDEYNIDHVTPGRAMMTLYRVTGDEKYLKAVELIRSQLKTHPRTKEGGFWHKNIYPWQMWLDGLYMGEPFYAEYSQLFNEDNWNDIANQFVWMEKHARDPKTGLLYHGWDESRQQKWANKKTGLSPHFWGRAMGWYAMALVDTLEYFPKDHPRRAEIVAILQREVEAIAKVQDKESGVWWQILNMPNAPKNYLESSCSVMFVYAIAKGVRLGYLPEKYMKVATTGWAGIKQRFMNVKPNGDVDFEGAVSVAGLGGNPYRDGSYDYYMSEKVRTNDWKSLGAAIKCAVEMETHENPQIGKGKTVLLDDYFNHEVKPDGSVWHYKWSERNHPGFQMWGKQFDSYGANLATLSAEPTTTNLNAASVYIIVDPDTDKETAKPNYVEPRHVKAIADWVKRGGVLVLMGNDGQNAELDKFNTLAEKFGIRFNKDRKFEVLNNTYKMGSIDIATDNAIFKTTKRIFVKEVSTLSLKNGASSVVSANGDTIMAIAKHGKGMVFVIGDPWLYNEYVDGRRLPAEFENHKAAQDLSRWLLEQTRKK